MTTPAQQAFTRIRNDASSLLDEATRRHHAGEDCGFRFLQPTEQPVVLASNPPTDGTFYIGDIHGDFLALHTLLSQAFESGTKSEVWLLGDIVDRGPHSFECFLLLLMTAMEEPGRIAWILGNHDEGVRFKKATNAFFTDTEPSEFVNWLNAQDQVPTEVAGRCGCLFESIASRLPRAVLQMDGLLVTHGGFPLSDLQPRLHRLEDLQSQECLQDFTWTRAARNRRKIPNRVHRGCSFGFEDFENFCAKAAGFFPVVRMLRGHDHVTGGSEILDNYHKAPVLTLNGFGFHPIYGPEFSAHYRKDLCLGRHRPNALPEIISVPVNLEDRDFFFPAPPETAPSESNPLSEKTETTQSLLLCQPKM